MKRFVLSAFGVIGLAVGLAFTAPATATVQCANCDSQRDAYLAINQAEYSYCTSTNGLAYANGEISAFTLASLNIACVNQKNAHDQDAWDFWWNCTP